MHLICAVSLDKPTLQFQYVPINYTQFELNVFWSSDTERCIKLTFSKSVSILFYISLEGGRITTDDFAKIPFHLVLFSAALVELAESLPVHSLKLSCHFFFCLPLPHFSFTVPYGVVFAKPEDLVTCQAILVFISFV